MKKTLPLFLFFLFFQHIYGANVGRVLNPADVKYPALVGDISGNIKTEENENIEGVTVNLTGPVNMTTTTDANGNYTFSAVPDGTYDICPELDIEPLNGVTTYDLVLVSKHILNVVPFDSPYKLIAADANGDGSIADPDPDVGDMLTIRKMILFITTNFPSGVKSWQFVSASHVFPDPSNAWDPIPPPTCEAVTINGGNINGVDFIGIKKGDLNGSAATGQ